MVETPEKVAERRVIPAGTYFVPAARPDPMLALSSSSRRMPEQVSLATLKLIRFSNGKM
jgi:hypothetical protein